MQEIKKVLENIYSLHRRILKNKFAEEVTEKEITALVEAENIIQNCIHHENDGWIPSEKCMPEEGQEVWISIKTDCVRRGMYTKRFGFGMREGFICSDGFTDINAVNAWKPYIIPEPYRPERSE